nr:EOG090X04TT [Eulimnadia texana]
MWGLLRVADVKTKFSLRQNVTIAVEKNAADANKQSKLVGTWLATCSGMVFGAVVIGGLTRLTESGLSMVHWKPFGEKLPIGREEWEQEFEKYKEFPEYKILKKDITLEDFKFIWWMEYGHRMWGRLIGAAFFIPAAIFWKKGFFNPAMKKRVVLFGSLLGFQGLLGWYMVRSGLEDRFHGESDVPRVSQYRLAAHLGSAFLLYSVFLWSALDKLLPVQQVKVTLEAAKLRRWIHASKGLVFLTAITGAFVAGLDAGLLYNSYPKMADRWVPEDILALSPAVRNVTENPTTVQFNHRNLGNLTVLLLSSVWLMSRKVALPPRARLATNCMAGMAWMQAALGISTLLTFVPTPLASMHQAGSLTLLSFAIWSSHEMKLMKFVPK